jgi:hypothetical protein
MVESSSAEEEGGEFQHKKANEEVMTGNNQERGRWSTC